MRPRNAADAINAVRNGLLMCLASVATGAEKYSCRPAGVSGQQLPLAGGEYGSARRAIVSVRVGAASCDVGAFMLTSSDALAPIALVDLYVAIGEL